MESEKKLDEEKMESVERIHDNSTMDFLWNDSIPECGLYVWNPDDALVLRKRYRLVGNAVGPLKMVNSKNRYSLPVVYFPEQIAFGILKGFIKFHDEKGNPISLRLSGSATDDSSDTDSLLLTRENHSFLWNYPSNELEHRRFAIFTELWNRSLYITSGIKFGGDYLIYNEDPLDCHATSVVQVVSGRDKMSTWDIISKGRTANMVRKTLTFAIYDEEKLDFIQFEHQNTYTQKN